MARKKSDEEPDFENSLNELESLVERMENGELSLEQSLQEFERGMLLSRQCQKMLNEAEQRVSILTDKESLQPFDAEQE